MDVGFDQPLYTVVEGSSVSVCVNLNSPDEIGEGEIVALRIAPGAGTATG